MIKYYLGKKKEVNQKMKRKPIEILADVINSLNGLQMNQQYSINELKSRSNIHWETALNYLQLIQFVQDYAPKIELDPETKNFKIYTYSHIMKSFLFEEQMILILFLKKAFSNEKRINERELWNTLPQDKMQSIINSQYIETIERNGKKFFILTRKGKFKAQSILAKINRSMAYSIDNYGKKLIKTSENFVLKPFRQDMALKELRLIKSNKTTEAFKKFPSSYDLFNLKDTESNETNDYEVKIQKSMLRTAVPRTISSANSA
ncbi:MAG: hypothetical protein DRO88_09200 [Promethearchaeia archaeon]|nr:MAG: hypothetical protein DRO88_09200 [Candidatus Lokiarchaeia archaeon]